VARKIQVDQQSIADVQAKMKETVDEMWAQQAAKGLRPRALPEGLKVIEALAKSPFAQPRAALLEERRPPPKGPGRRRVAKPRRNPQDRA
jgi:hypothetical protein